MLNKRRIITEADRRKAKLESQKRIIESFNDINSRLSNLNEDDWMRQPNIKLIDAKRVEDGWVVNLLDHDTEMSGYISDDKILSGGKTMNPDKWNYAWGDEKFQQDRAEFMDKVKETGGASEEDLRQYLSDFQYNFDGIMGTPINNIFSKQFK